jgi:hypothetical protein
VISRYSRTSVECYAGYRGEEEPRRFLHGDRMVEITEILDRWLDPDHRYFKVRVNDEGFYILRHDSNSGEWELRVYLRGGLKEGEP